MRTTDTLSLGRGRIQIRYYLKTISLRPADLSLCLADYRRILNCFNHIVASSTTVCSTLLCTVTLQENINGIGTCVMSKNGGIGPIPIQIIPELVQPYTYKG